MTIAIPGIVCGQQRVKGKKVIVSRVEVDYDEHVEAGDGTVFWQSLLLARSRLCFCELAVYREAIFLPEFEFLSCSELNIYIYIYIYIVGCLPFSNRTEHGRRGLPTSSLVEN